MRNTVAAIATFACLACSSATSPPFADSLIAFSTYPVTAAGPLPRSSCRGRLLPLNLKVNNTLHNPHTFACRCDGVPHKHIEYASQRLTLRCIHAQMRNDRGEGKVNRRVVLALASLPLFGLRKASAMTEAEELVKLQAEAARIQEIFDVQKAANANLPSLKDSLKASKSSSPDDKIVRSSTKAEEVAVDTTNVQEVRFVSLRSFFEV